MDGGQLLPSNQDTLIFSPELVWTGCQLSEQLALPGIRGLAVSRS